jgi:hypothetical protein
MTSRTSTFIRRLALATLFAGAATLSASAFGDPATACAAPREWDIGAYDDCVATVWIEGDISPAQNEEMYDSIRWCCEYSGGVWNADSVSCAAPPAEQAQEAERAPAGTPFLPPESQATLWMPPPPPPPPPPEGVIAPGPASRN